jgi:nitrogen regulatory protein PII
MQDFKYSLIITIVNKGFSNDVMEAARLEGVSGGTVMRARGTAELEVTKFMGFTIEPEKDVVLVLVENEKRAATIKAIHAKAGLGTNGHGLTFSLPVKDVIGGFSLNNQEEE